MISLIERIIEWVDNSLPLIIIPLVGIMFLRILISII